MDPHLALTWWLWGGLLQSRSDRQRGGGTRGAKDKYPGLREELERMMKVKVTVVTVVIGTLGKRLLQIPGTTCEISVQQSAVLGILSLLTHYPVSVDLLNQIWCVFKVLLRFFCESMDRFFMSSCVHTQSLKQKAGVLMTHYHRGLSLMVWLP